MGVAATLPELSEWTLLHLILAKKECTLLGMFLNIWRQILLPRDLHDASL